MAALLALGLPSAHGGFVTPAKCRLDPATHVLSISLNGRNGLSGVGIRRMGSRIVISETVGRPEVPCGETPTVTTTERIEIAAEGLTDVDVDLGGGTFAPGVTPEADGSSEIEVFISGGSMDVEGGNGADHFQYLTADGATGINLESGSEDRDVDFGLSGEVQNLVPVFAEGGRGPDIFEVVGRLPLVVTMDGGKGNDTLLAGRVATAFLTGGSGRDRIVGSDRFDDITPGRGADTVDGRGGGDLIELVLDRQRDRIDCGGGDDLTSKPDRFDRLRSCEKLVGESRR